MRIYLIIVGQPSSCHDRAMKKRYDLFASYSSRDRDAVDALVRKLSERGLSVWYDQWEMRPGDRLRDRILDGIQASRYFLVMLSPHSVDAPWVKIELDSAMLREIEAKHVIVIPVLIGDVQPSQIPADMRGKHYLDLRDPQKSRRELDRLLSLFELDRRREQQHRRARLRALRAGLPESPDAVGELRTLISTSWNDYAVQKAALAGLVKIGSGTAMLGIAERMLDLGGIEPLEYCIKLCIDASSTGGLFLLSSTLFYDSRFISRKLDAMSTIVRKKESPTTLELLIGLGDTAQLHREPVRVKEWSHRLASSSDPDIANGIIFGAQFDIGMGWQRTFMETFPTSDVKDALEYAERRFRGITGSFRRASDGKHRPLHDA